MVANWFQDEDEDARKNDRKELEMHERYAPSALQNKWENRRKFVQESKTPKVKLFSLLKL